MIQLPDCYLITGEAPTPAEWWRRFDSLLAMPEPLIQLRLHPAVTSDDDPRVWEALSRCRKAGARLLLNAPPRLARAYGADGVHLDSRTLVSLDERPLPANLLVGASCHDEMELGRAVAVEADFVCLSPLRETRSHPGQPVMGFQRFKELVRSCPVPVYALGGLSFDDLPAVKAAGGHGVAGISAFWG